jgi:hypothetical protein
VTSRISNRKSPVESRRCTTIAVLMLAIASPNSTNATRPAPISRRSSRIAAYIEPAAARITAESR